MVNQNKHSTFQGMASYLTTVISFHSSAVIFPNTVQADIFGVSTFDTNYILKASATNCM